MTTDPFGRHMEVVAKHFWGDPNLHASTKTELRWGSHGARCVDLEKGVWYDNEAGEGGGVLDLVSREASVMNGGAVAYLRDTVGLDIPDDRRPIQSAPATPRKIVATYDYIDEVGEVLFQVVRFEPKTFRQRRPDPTEADGWSWSVKGVRQVPYRLPEVIEAMSTGSPVCIVEGEKDADELWKIGVPATCNAGGAGKWPESLVVYFLGASVVILPDNDDAGRNHAHIVGANLQDITASTRVLDLPGLGPKGDISDWLKAGGSASALHELIETRATPWKPAPPKSRFGAIAWADIDKTTTRYDSLVKGLLYQGDTAMFYGESGSGKSFLAVDMGLAIARGEPFLGMKTVAGGVLYQAGEGGKGLIKRLKAYRQYFSLHADDLPFVLLPDKVNLFSPDGDAEAFIEECVAFKASMQPALQAIFIDTFSAASMGANENASEDMGRMLDAGYRLNRATGAAVIWVHHKNAGGLRERGHTSFRANIETVVEVTKDPETKERTLHLVKLKDGEDGLRLGFELYPVEIGTDDDGDPITSCVVRPAQVGSGQAGKRPRLAHSQRNFLLCLDEAIDRYGGVTPVTKSAPINTMGVEWHHFRTLYIAVKGVTLDDNAIRQALHREGEALMARGLIGKDNPFVWITDKGREMLRYGV